MENIVHALAYYAAFAACGVIGLAVTRRAFPASLTVSWVLAKPIGLLLFAWPIWFLASVGFLRANAPGLVHFLFIAALAAAGVLLWSVRTRPTRAEQGERKHGKVRHPWHEALVRAKGVVWVEGITLVLYLGYLYVRSHAPAIEGTEKFMDMVMLSSAGKTGHFPFADAWQALKTVNYYYYGYYLYALLANLARVPFAVAYGCALALVFATSSVAAAVAVFRIVPSRFYAVVGAFFVSLAGNLHYAACYFRHAGPELGAKCYYPMASRVYDPSYTITEFPFYSHLVADLHPHVMSLPLFTAAVLLVGEVWRAERLSKSLVAVSVTLVSALALVNTWDFMTIGLLLALVVAPGFRASWRAASSASLPLSARARMALWANRGWTGFLAACAASPFVLFLPFFLSFTSPVKGVGFIPTFVSVAGISGKAQWPSTPWFLFGIWGIALTTVLLGWLATRAAHPDRRPALWLLGAMVGASIGLIVFAELFFFRDLFHITNPPYFRANTIFKFGYHAWMLLGISAASLLGLGWQALVAQRPSAGALWRKSAFGAGVAALLYVAALYPLNAIGQVYDPSWPWTDRAGRAPRTLDGSAFIASRHPEDAEAIRWLNENQPERVVVLEAAGASYTYAGRIGVFTGMANPANWEVHQWTHRFHYPPGAATWREALKGGNTGYDDIAAVSQEVRAMYESGDTARVAELLAKYKVSYVWVGPLERETYDVREEPFKTLATPMLTYGNATLYRLNDAPRDPL